MRRCARCSCRAYSDINFAPQCFTITHLPATRIVLTCLRARCLARDHQAFPLYSRVLFLSLRLSSSPCLFCASMLPLLSSPCHIRLELGAILRRGCQSSHFLCTIAASELLAMSTCPGMRFILQAHTHREFGLADGAIASRDSPRRMGSRRTESIHRDMNGKQRISRVLPVKFEGCTHIGPARLGLTSVPNSRGVKLMHLQQLAKDRNMNAWKHQTAKIE